MADRTNAWAKAPEFADQPEVRHRLREQTAADRTEYLEHGLQPVECQRCGTCVRVKKNSPKHTSVQWSGDPSTSCARFADALARGRPSAHLDGCADLESSIDSAVRDGRIHVADTT